VLPGVNSLFAQQSRQNELRQFFCSNRSVAGWREFRQQRWVQGHKTKSDWLVQYPFEELTDVSTT
jgi:hypothetical protein